MFGTEEMTENDKCQNKKKSDKINAIFSVAFIESDISILRKNVLFTQEKVYCQSSRD